MSKYAVVGGGIVGVATALQLLENGHTVTLYEKALHLAPEQTGHNSGVIHAGVYYQPGSLKAEFCKEGAAWTKEYCDKKGIKYETPGKLIVATTKEEVERLDALASRCLENGIIFDTIYPKELKELEPNVKGLKALLVHDTGIVDYAEVTRSLADDVRRLGGTIELGWEVTNVDVNMARPLLDLKSHKGVQKCEWFDKVIVCAGIKTDELMLNSGIEINWRMVPFRGEYYRVDNNSTFHHLVYPVPDPELPFLGVHITNMVDGSVTVGPNAVTGLSKDKYPKLSVTLKDCFRMLAFSGFWKVARKNFKIGLKEQYASLNKAAYLKMVQKYTDAITLKDLKPYPCGIRAQAVHKDGSLIEDFFTEKHQNVLFVVNAPSPAATSAMPIAKHLVQLSEEKE